MSYAGPVRYVCADVERLIDLPLVGDGQCVALVKEKAKAPATMFWLQGKTVKGTPGMPKGTAIATFVNGKYPNHGTGNHAALFVSQNVIGITVVDQWFGKKSIGKRVLRFKGKNAAGTFVDPSNNGDAFSIIL